MNNPSLKPDIVIFGAGIAGLWMFHRLKQMGYDVLLLERNAIGCGQTLASQGIIHSGLKYTLAGQINELARSISAMPDLWRSALKGTDEVNLSGAKDSTYSQYMLIPKGFMGELVKLVSKKALGRTVIEIPAHEWPEDIKASGFKGSVIYMDEPVLDINAIIRALADPYKDNIRKTDGEPLAFLKTHNIQPRMTIFSAAESNHKIAKAQGHDQGLKTQARPLLMGMMRPAPYPLYIHLVGTSEKPIATITTHKAEDETLVWYIGGGVAERNKDDDPQALYTDIKAALAKYLPAVDLSTVEWATLPIDRIEGHSDSQGRLPDTPTLHKVENTLYCWPTKLTFAPMLSDMVLEQIDFEPRTNASDFSCLQSVEYARAPWDKASWKK